MTVRSIVYGLVLLLSTGCALNRTPTQTSRSATRTIIIESGDRTQSQRLVNSAGRRRIRDHRSCRICRSTDKRGGFLRFNLCHTTRSPNDSGSWDILHFGRRKNATYIGAGARAIPWNRARPHILRHATSFKVSSFHSRSPELTLYKTSGHRADICGFSIAMYEDVHGPVPVIFDALVLQARRSSINIRSFFLFYVQQHRFEFYQNAMTARLIRNCSSLDSRVFHHKTGLYAGPKFIKKKKKKKKKGASPWLSSLDDSGTLIRHVSKMPFAREEGGSTVRFRTLMLGILAILFLAVGILAFPLLYDPDAFKQFLLDQVERQIGRKIEVRAAHLEVFPEFVSN